MLTVASGELVPNATIVSPTSSGEILRNPAIFEAPSTKKFAPAIKRANPMIRSKYDTFRSTSYNYYDYPIMDCI
jgi:hypothetical protein